VSKPSDMVQGTLDMLILKILALEPLNGWAISQRLKQISSDVLGVSDGSLYPALHKLEPEVGFGLSGGRVKTTDVPSLTRSRGWGGSSSKKRPPTGTASQPPFPA
jgi:hypothetical protein